MESRANGGIPAANLHIPHWLRQGTTSRVHFRQLYTSNELMRLVAAASRVQAVNRRHADGCFIGHGEIPHPLEFDLHQFQKCSTMTLVFGEMVLLPSPESKHRKTELF